MPDTMPTPQTEPVEETKPKPPPTVYLNGEDLDRLNLHDCVPGEDYTATITFRVAGADMPSEGDPSKRIELTSMDNVQPAGGEMPGDDLGLEGEPAGEDMPEENPVIGSDLGVPDAEEKLLGYKRPKKSAGPSVDMKKFIK